MNPVKAEESLAKMMETFRQRNKLYGDNYLKEGELMWTLFPDGIKLEGQIDYVRYHLLHSIIVKLTRFVNSGMTHRDSIHDAGVYCAMLEDFIAQNYDRD